MAWQSGGLKAMENEKQRQKDQELKDLMKNVECVLKKFGRQAQPGAQKDLDECCAVDLSNIVLEFV